MYILIRSLVVGVSFFVGITACATSHGSHVTDQTTKVSQQQNAVTKTEIEKMGIITQASNNDFAITLALAEKAITARDFRIFTTIDHAAGAASVDLPLSPTSLIIFGNPKGGTLLMQSAQTMGLELPLKMLIHENAEGKVFVSWPDMATILNEHGVDDHAPLLERIQNGLQAIANDATGNS